MKTIRVLSLVFATIVWLAAPLRTFGQPAHQKPKRSTPQEQSAPKSAPDEKPIPTGKQLFGLSRPLPVNPDKASSLREHEIVYRDAELEDIIQALAEECGLNVVFDSTFRSRKLNLQLHGLKSNQALESVLEGNNLFAEPINDRTIIVSVDNTANRARLEHFFVRTFYLKYTDPQIAQTQLAVLFGQRVLVVPDAELRAVTVRTSLPSLEMVEDLIEKIDRRLPTKNIEMTVYLLAASETAGEPLPSLLRGVIERAGISLPTGPYRLLDTLFGRLRTGRNLDSLIKGVAPSSPIAHRTSLYSLRVDSLQVSSEGARQMIDTHLRLEGRVPIAVASPEKEGQSERISYETTGFTLDAKVPEGEPVIIGRTPLLEPGVPVLVILSAKVMP